MRAASSVSVTLAILAAKSPKPPNSSGPNRDKRAPVAADCQTYTGTDFPLAARVSPNAS